MNILYCILHTQRQESRAHNILSTWGKDQNILFYSDHEDKTINCHKVTEQSDYSSGQIKQINIFPLLLTNFNYYDWYFFCDNDTFVNTKLMRSFTVNADYNKIHCQILNTWPNDVSLYYPSGGAGYLVSGHLLKQFTNLKYNDTQFSDVSIGINIRDKKLILQHRELFKSQPPKFYNIDNAKIKDYISFHYITTRTDMQMLENNL